MKVLARRLQDTNNVLAASSFLAANGRVAGALLSIAEAFGKDVGNGRIRREQRLTFGEAGWRSLRCRRFSSWSRIAR
jgi:CRP-like cAMP-binding protein